MKNKLFVRFFETLFIFGFIFFVCPIISFSHDIEKGVNDTVYWANDAYGKFDTEKDDYIIYYADLIVLEAERAALTVSYNSNKSTMRKEAAKLASDAIPTDFAIWGSIKDTATNASIIVITASDDLDLKKALIGKTIEIQKKKVDVAAQFKLVDSAYDHYIAHVDAYNKSKWNSPTTKSDDMTPTKKGKILSDEIGVDTNLSVKCSNSKCSTVYSASKYGLDNIVTLSEGGSAGGYKGHLETCSESPCNNRTYWNCPNDSNPDCPEYETHKLVLCRGGCGKKGPREYLWGSGINGPRVKSEPGSPFYARPLVTIASHIKKCPGQWYYGFTKSMMPCKEWYYQCSSSNVCPNKKCTTRGGYDSTAQTPSTPSTPTPSTPKVSTPGSASLSPSSGSSYTASSGGTHTAGVSVPSGYQYVYWYIAGPGIDGLGLLKQTDTGNGSSTSASFSWSIPSYASGDHVITAYTQLSDGSIVEPSYTVTVGSSSTTSSTSSRYYCPWCGNHYNPNNNNSCETRGGSHDGFPDPE